MARSRKNKARGKRVRSRNNKKGGFGSHSYVNLNDIIPQDDTITIDPSDELIQDQIKKTLKYMGNLKFITEEHLDKLYRFATFLKVKTCKFNIKNNGNMHSFYCNNDNKPGVEILVQVDNNDKAKITTFVDDKDENNRFKLYAPGVSVKKKMNNNQYPHRNVYVDED